MPNLNNPVYSGTLWAGSIWYNAPAAPTSELGVNGDYFFNYTTADVYYKSNNAWTLQINLKGPQGIQGIQGNTGNQGNQGIQGNAGSNGTDGTDGATIRTGFVVPSNATGKDGDLYVNTVSGNLYQRVSGAYVQQGNLLGPQGLQGAKGDAGAGFPAGGLGGQFLRKASNSSYDTTWVALSGTDISTALGYTPIGATTTSAVSIQNTNASTNLATGALTVSGGVGIQGAVNIGGSASVGGNLVISGDITVAGTALKVTSTQVSVVDNIINLSGTATLLTNDSLDRGIAFQWHNGVVGKLGYFGFKRSTQQLVYIPDATETSGIITGSAGEIDLSGSLNQIRNAFTQGNNILISNGVISASYTEVSTLAQVTARGATTSDKVTISNATNTSGAGTGALVVAGGASIGGSLVVTGAIVAGSLSYSGGSQIDNIPIGQTVPAAGGFTVLRSSDTTDSTNTATGAFVTAGGVGIAKGLYVGTTSTFLGQIRAQANITSSGTTSGSLIVTGGVGVTGTIYAGALENTPIGAVTAASANITVATVSSQLNVTNGTTSTTAGTGCAVFTGGLGVGAASTFGSTLRVIGVLNTTTNANIGGNAYVTGDVYSAYTSDETLKDLIRPVTDATEKLRTLESWFYKFKEGLDKDQSQPIKIGLLAGQVAKVFPEIVKIRDDKTKAVFYEQMIPVLIAGFNELDKRITALENK